MDTTEIILVRHGQANTGATSEESYDKLSPIGHQQAAWLGQHFTDQGQKFDHVICGTLRRHRETAAGLDLPHELDIDARVNEMRYFDMAEEYLRTTGTPVPTGPLEFAAHVPLVFTAWEAGLMDKVHEPYADFSARFEAVMAEAVTRGGRTLIVTSGGVIAMAMVRHLGLCSAGLARMLLPVRNASLHHFGVFDGQTHIQSFNATPHLDAHDRVYARTSI